MDVLQCTVDLERELDSSLPDITLDLVLVFHQHVKKESIKSRHFANSGHVLATPEAFFPYCTTLVEVVTDEHFSLF